MFLENYILQKKIGSGTYGKVYKGSNVRNKLPVAIKKILNLSDSEGVTFSVMREISCL